MVYYAENCPKAADAASPATLPGTVAGFAGSPSCKPVVAPEQTPTPCAQITAFCVQPIPEQIPIPTAHATPALIAAMLPTVETAARAFGSGIAATPCLTTRRVPSNPRVKNAPFLPKLPNPSTTSIVMA